MSHGSNTQWHRVNIFILKGRDKRHSKERLDQRNTETQKRAYQTLKLPPHLTSEAPRGINLAPMGLSSSASLVWPPAPYIGALGLTPLSVSSFFSIVSSYSSYLQHISFPLQLRFYLQVMEHWHLRASLWSLRFYTQPGLSDLFMESWYKPPWPKNSCFLNSFKNQYHMDIKFCC